MLSTAVYMLPSRIFLYLLILLRTTSALSTLSSGAPICITGRGPIGSAEGMVYFMKDAAIIPCGRKVDVPMLRTAVSVQGRD